MEKSMDQKIAYEKHPVSPERKKKLREQGFIIVDARFKPKGEADSKKASDQVDTEQAKDALKAAGVEFDARIGKDKAAALYAAFAASGMTGEAWNALDDAEKAKLIEAVK